MFPTFNEILAQCACMIRAHPLACLAKHILLLKFNGLHLCRADNVSKSANLRICRFPGDDLTLEMPEEHRSLAISGQTCQSGERETAA